MEYAEPLGQMGESLAGEAAEQHFMRVQGVFEGAVEDRLAAEEGCDALEVVGGWELGGWCGLGGHGNLPSSVFFNMTDDGSH